MASGGNLEFDLFTKRIEQTDAEEREDDEAADEEDEKMEVEGGLDDSAKVGPKNSNEAKKAKLQEKQKVHHHQSLSRQSNQKPPDSDIWIFDIETDQSCGNEGVHKPILLIAESLTGEQVVYVGYECVSNFCQAVFAANDRIRKTEWFIAHFGSGFDFLPILEWLYKQHKYIPKILLRGNKVVSMRVGNKRFIDSYLFIPIPLSKFTSTFNLKELKKGYFPHLLTSAEALYPSSTQKVHSLLNCVKGVNCSLRQTISTDCSHCKTFLCNSTPGPSAASGDQGDDEFAFKPGQFPPACLYALNSMKGERNVKNFLEWHTQQTHYYKQSSKTYNFQQELITYCESDVKLLKEGFIEYRRLIRSICKGIDPFEVACTAASACNFIYRQLYMPKNSIAILPNNGYTGNELTSFPAALWLSWIEKVAWELLETTNQVYCEVRLYKSGGGSRRGKGKEQTLGSFKVDGLLLLTKSSSSNSTNSDVSTVSKHHKNLVHPSIVLEFFGCFYHGCPACYPNRTEINKKRNGMSMHDLYTTTVVDRLNWLQLQTQTETVFTTSDQFKFFVQSVFHIWECEMKQLLQEKWSNFAGLADSLESPEEKLKSSLPSTLKERLSRNFSTRTNVWQESDFYTLKHLQELIKCSKDTKRYSPLQPRDAFVGGRTENFVTQWSRKTESQTFCYVDVCSLYPYVNSRCLYPVGHPDQIFIATEQRQFTTHFRDKYESKSQNTVGEFSTSEFCSANITNDVAEIVFLEREDRILNIARKNSSNQLDGTSSDETTMKTLSPTDFSTASLSDYEYTTTENKILTEVFFGIVKCEVLPPSDLHLPILPFKYQSKLFFPLCKRCVEERSSVLDRRSLDMTSNLCGHFKTEDRSFWGTFATPELKLAIEAGYRILDVAEIWSWSTSNRSTSLFKEYIDTFLKIKMEASGWPSEGCCETATKSVDILCEHRRKFLEDIRVQEGIELNPANVKKNEGLRFIAKILLNSFWGYLGMRDNMPKTRYVNNYREVVEYFTSKTKRVTDATLVGDDLMLLQYQLIDDAADSPRKTNVILAAFTTAHARVILYRNMQQVKDPRNVLYCDTDSIMYVHDKSVTAQQDIPVGSGMGNMTNELPGDVLIDRFWSAGPKFYCFSGHNIVSGLEYNVFKVKGVTLNRATEKTFNPETFKKLILGETHELRSPFTSLSRCVRTGKVKTRYCEKKARVTSNKRVFDMKTGVSTPFGFLYSP